MNAAGCRNDSKSFFLQRRPTHFLSTKVAYNDGIIDDIIRINPNFNQDDAMLETGIKAELLRTIKMLNSSIKFKTQ